MTLIFAIDIATRTPRRDRYVYALFAGRQLLPCYIGIGKGDRLRRHLTEAKREKRHDYKSRKYKILRACIARRIPITARQIASSLTIEEACTVERMLINIYGRRDLGTGCLLNACAGGLGVRNVAPSTKKKLAEAGRRHMARPGIKELLNERKSTPEARARTSAASKGRIPSLEARAKMSASCKKRNERDQENWQRFLASQNRDGWKDGRHSAEAKAKISEALKQQWREGLRSANGKTFLRPEVKAVVDAARFGRKTMLGRKHSIETRMKMSAAHKARRAGDRVDIST